MSDIQTVLFALGVLLGIAGIVGSVLLWHKRETEREAQETLEHARRVRRRAIRTIARARHEKIQRQAADRLHEARVEGVSRKRLSQIDADLARLERMTRIEERQKSP